MRAIENILLFKPLEVYLGLLIEVLLTYRENTYHIEEIKELLSTSKGGGVVDI